MKSVHLLILVLLVVWNLQAQDVSFESSNLPIVVIDTHGKEIPDDYRIVADMGIIYNGPGERNYLNQPFNEFQGKIAIELRGSSSKMFPKKQYALETQTDDGENLNVSLLGLPKENDWILNGPYSDKTLIRNVLIYQLSRELGQYASRTRFCELVLNGDYRGVYILMEKIKRDKNRVNIAKLKEDEISGLDVTGGYIVKIDKKAGEQVDGWQSIFPPYPQASSRIYFQYHYPKPDRIVPQQKSYIQNWMFNFEMTLFKNTFTDPDSGYYRWVNLPSFVDFLLLNEISKNVDGYRLSTFMYKDRADKDNHLHMGPIWDFNLAFGNANYYHGFDPTGWQWQINYDEQFVAWDDPFLVPFWWEKLMSDSVFVKQVIHRYSELRQSIFSLEHLFGLIDAYADTLNEAQERNFQRWPILGQYVWPNYFIGQTYEAEIQFLKDWIEDRLNWLDSQLFDSQPPEAPTQITVTEVTHSKISLSWNEGSDNVGIAGYDVFLNEQYVKPTRLTHVTLYNLEDNHTYSIAVKSRDFSGNRSSNSAKVEATTKPFTPDDGLTCVKVAEPILIDGHEESTWKPIDWQSVSHVLLDDIKDSTDLSAKFKMAWDETNIYFLVRIWDDVKIRDSGINTYLDDDLELILDMNYLTDQALEMYRFNYRFTFLDSQVVEVKHNAKHGVKYNVTLLNDGYLAEIALPWQTLNSNAQLGKLIGFDLQINDDDDGGRRDSKIGWSSSSTLGLVKFKQTLTGIVPVKNVPHSTVLIRNFPNPFNGHTWLSIILPSSREVKLELIDLQGRRVKTLYSGFLLKGQHRFKLNLQNRASGLYFIQLIDKSGLNQTHKLIYLK